MMKKAITRVRMMAFVDSRAVRRSHHPAERPTVKYADAYAQRTRGRRSERTEDVHDAMNEGI
jgi:hypothetical protein